VLDDGTVAEGAGGVEMIEVGVGTGGSSVRVGSGEPDVTMTDGTEPLGAVLAMGAPGSDDSTATGLGGRGDQSSTDEVAGVVTRAGAAPSPPAPPGALTGGGTGAGAPRVQPATTAKGSPRATTLKKMDLGENRTSEHRIRSPKSYGAPAFALNCRPGNGLISRSPARYCPSARIECEHFSTGREMNSGRPRGLAAMLTLALGAGTVAGAGLFGSPAWAEGTLTGTYTLDSTSIWTGQQVTLTQTALEDSTPESAAVRTVDWGDNTVEPLLPDATKKTHKYAANGTYKVKVTLSDTDAGEGTATITNATSDVVVATAAGSYKFNVASNWTWEGGGANAKLLLSGVPANATRVWVDWGEGQTSLLGRNHTSTTHYYPVGTHSARVTLENAQGKTTAKATGNYTVKVDYTNPSSTLKVPKSPSKAKSWKTIQGTAKDGQIGMDSVGVQLWKWTSTKDYYYNFSTKKWVKYVQGQTKIPNAAVSWRGVDAKGVWKVGVAGLSKGYHLEVDYVAVDRAGNDNGWKYRVQKLTK
jgi:hypothetical protein